MGKVSFLSRMCAEEAWDKAAPSSISSKGRLGQCTSLGMAADLRHLPVLPVVGEGQQEKCTCREQLEKLF